MTPPAVRRFAASLAAFGLIAALTACEPLDDLGAGTAGPNAPSVEGPVPDGTLDAVTAKTRLAELADAVPAGLDGYARDCDDGQACVFGQPWLDVDGDGCD
jgi:Protein of unknown function (DUF1524)